MHMVKIQLGQLTVSVKSDLTLETPDTLNSGFL